MVTGYVADSPLWGKYVLDRPVLSLSLLSLQDLHIYNDSVRLWLSLLFLSRGLARLIIYVLHSLYIRSRPQTNYSRKQNNKKWNHCQGPVGLARFPISRLTTLSFLCKNFIVIVWEGELAVRKNREIFSYGHSSPAIGMKLKRSRLVHICTRAEISHVNSKKITHMNRRPNSFPLTRRTIPIMNNLGIYNEFPLCKHHFSCRMIHDSWQNEIHYDLAISTIVTVLSAPDSFAALRGNILL